MPTNTYIPLANITLSSASTSITFSNISQAYRDLVLVFNGSDNPNGDETGRIRLNGDSGSNYSGIRMSANGSAATAGSWLNVTGLYYGILDSGQANAIIHILDYSATNKQKQVLSRMNAIYGTSANAWRWASTAAVTSVNFGTYSNLTYAAGSTFSLYGIAA